MSDQTQFPDDPAQWDAVVLAPADVGDPPGPQAPRPKSEVRGDDTPRLQALEDRLDRLTAAVEAQRIAVDTAVADHLARTQADLSAALEARLNQLDTYVSRRLDEIDQRAAVAAAAGPTAPPAPLTGLEADRIDAVERQLHESMTRLHRTIDGFRTQSAGKVELEGLRSQLRAEIAQAHGQAVTAAGDVLGDAVRATALREQLDVLTQAVAELRQDEIGRRRGRAS